MNRDHKKCGVNDADFVVDAYARPDANGAGSGADFGPQGETPQVDKNGSSSRHGFISRHPQQALVKGGEDQRSLRRLKGALREELQPRGVLGELLFDNAWACLLRRKLIAQAEEKLFDQEGKPLNERLKEAGLWGMAGAKPQNSVVHELPNIVGYDSYMSREFFRSIGMLLAFRNDGSAGLAQLLSKRFAQAHRQEEAAVDADRETSITDLGPVTREDKITKVGQPGT